MVSELSPREVEAELVDSISVAIFTARESESTLQRTISSVLAAGRGWRASVVDVLVNGNPHLAHAISHFRPPLPAQCQLRVWQFDYPDKANTWNEYLYTVIPDCDYAFFIDGYAELEPGALRSMLLAHKHRPTALAVSGIQRLGPSAGRLLQRQLERGGLCGNLYALTRETVRRAKEARFRLPIGIYRTDPTLGAVLCFNFEPHKYTWDSQRLLTVPEASFSYRVPRPWRIDDLRSFARRRLRQAQGLLENRAIRQHLLELKLPPASIPSNVHSLVVDWGHRNPRELRSMLLGSPLALLAYRRLLEERPPKRSLEPPTLLLSLP